MHHQQNIVYFKVIMLVVHLLQLLIYSDITMSYIKVNILLLTFIIQIQSICQQPQKSIYLSFNSLSNQDHIQNLFLNISKNTSQYSMKYTDPEFNQNYYFHQIRYNITYNNHFQKEIYIDPQSVRVQLGFVDLLATFQYNITDHLNKSLYSGVGFAKSYLDPAFFDKNIVEKDGFIEWQAKNIDHLGFRALWTVQPIFNFPHHEHHIMESMMNSVVDVGDLRPHIQDDINNIYQKYIKDYLNSQKMFSTSAINYEYNGIKMPVTHSIKNITVDEKSKGLVALLSFGINGVEQKKCGSVPKNYYQRDYGGSVEYVTMNTVQFMVEQAINRGLFNITLDKNWQSNNFQFFMGDLGNAVPYANNNPSTQTISISCQSQNISKILVTRFDDKKIYVETPSRCSIKQSSTTILEVTMQLIATVIVKAQNSQLLVEISQFYPRKIKYISKKKQYVVPDLSTDIPEMMISSILAKTIKSTTFGTYFPTLYRKYPATIINDQYLIIFDWSQLGSENMLLERKTTE